MWLFEARRKIDREYNCDVNASIFLVEVCPSTNIGCYIPFHSVTTEIALGTYRLINDVMVLPDQCLQLARPAALIAIGEKELGGLLADLPFRLE